MSSMIGKSTGIALLMAAALLAALFAMGVFSATGVGADVVADDATTDANEGPTVELSDYSPGATGVTMTVTFQVTADVDNDVVTTFTVEGGDGEFDFPTIAGGNAGDALPAELSITQDGVAYPQAQVDVDATAIDAETITIKVTSEASDPPVAGEVQIEAGQDIVITIGGMTNPSTAGDYMVKVHDGGTAEVEATVTIPNATGMLSSKVPGAAVQITLNAFAGTEGIQPNEDITVDFGTTGFDLPATIADNGIDITSTADDANLATTGFRGSPTNVVVSGSKITMTIPNVNAAGEDQTKAVTGAYAIKIKQSARVSNPASAGSKTIKISENAPLPDGTDPKEATVSINRVISLSKTSGTRGTMTTATLKGFSNGTATLRLNGEKLGEATITDNIGMMDIDTTSSKFMPNMDNKITAQDGSGNQEDVSATFNISPKVVLDPEETSVSKMVTLKLSDWPTGNAITEVKIGATDATPATTDSTDTDGKAEFMVQVPSGVNRGTQTVKVTGTDTDPADPDVSAPSASASLKIGVLSLTAQPAMVVPGQQITIQGSGFVAGDRFNNVSVGGNDVTLSPAVEASSAGDIVITINVPSPSSGAGIGDGEKAISVETMMPGGSGRVAEGSIMIPEASISLSPETSRRGTTVDVTGSGFPSGDLVQIQYENNNNFVTVAAGSADASGAVSISFVVPSYARIGSEHEVMAQSVGVYAGVTAEATHETPGAMIELSADQIASGQNITITGMNFPAFATVAVMEIGDVDVRPVPAPATSIDGDFESTVLVPQLELGNQTVSVRVSQTTITTFLEISEMAAPSAPAEVFADLIASERLSRVWYLDAANQEWTFYDPAPEFADFNDLTSVSSGDVVTIIVSEGDTMMFQGRTLYPGTNLVPLR